ncbi:MAG TPA: hypothetical protein VGF94_23485 [Kofleriaceae bacterium]|jgi:hypothetical protein
MEGPSAFVDLRRLMDWFASLAGGARATQVEKIVARLGSTCVPLLGRELAGADGRRREAARAGLASLAIGETRVRVVAELRRVAASDAGDDGKVCALGLLAELGERGAAQFVDGPAVQRRSALALAAQLDTPAEIAAAADMMVRQLGTDVLHLLGVLADAVPTAAHRLAAELGARLDLEGELRERVADFALASPATEPSRARRSPRAEIAVLVDAAARLVVVASHKVLGEKRWRRWAVLVDQRGLIDDCLHDDRACDDAAALIESLVDDGYRVASRDSDHARALVAAAARRTGDHGTLDSAYYLGRDLLDLRDAHLGAHVQPASTTLGRAIELIEDGEHGRAQALLARCDLAQPEAAAAAAACALAAGQAADALDHLTRAIEGEPEWPLHHWNAAAACHQLGDARGCYHALRRFVATSARPTGLYADPDQPGRVALAMRLIAELERTSRLAGTPLHRRKRRRTAKRG